VTMRVLYYFMTSDVIFYTKNALLHTKDHVTRHFVTRHLNSYKNQNMQFEIITFGTPEYDELVQLRTEILRKPLGLEFTPEFLANEWRDTHLAAYTDEYALVATLLLSEKDAKTVQMRQVAVATNAQRKGVGAAIVAFSEAVARKNGYEAMVLHARDTAVDFYLAQAYTKVGAPFVEVGIPHIAMEKRL
jgi:predicted GNAT family N-acyltransferase